MLEKCPIWLAVSVSPTALKLTQRWTHMTTHAHEKHTNTHTERQTHIKLHKHTPKHTHTLKHTNMQTKHTGTH